MQDLLYYPSFEIYNENWLKFALLYIDRLHPIVPHKGDNYISDYSKKIYEESDLLEKYRPEYQEAYNATLDALEVIEKILSHPDRYSPIFHSSQINNIWCNPNYFNYTIFEDKYTGELESFLIKHKLAKKSYEGINLSKSLGFLYMSIFAHVISDLNEIPPITDISALDRFSIFIRHVSKIGKEKITVAQKVIELKLPDNLEEIPLDNILSLRRKRYFKEKLKAFHISLNNFLESEDEDKIAENFIRKHKHIYNEFNAELLKLGLGLASFAVGVWIMTKQPETTGLEIAQKFSEGGAFLLSGVSINKSWNNTKTKRYCKKYLAHLEKLEIA